LLFLSRGPAGLLFATDHGELSQTTWPLGGACLGGSGPVSVGRLIVTTAFSIESPLTPAEIAARIRSSLRRPSIFAPWSMRAPRYMGVAAERGFWLTRDSTWRLEATLHGGSGGTRIEAIVGRTLFQVIPPLAAAIALLAVIVWGLLWNLRTKGHLTERQILAFAVVCGMLAVTWPRTPRKEAARVRAFLETLLVTAKDPASTAAARPTDPERSPP
jgi:hypothetical protein